MLSSAPYSAMNGGKGDDPYAAVPLKGGTAVNVVNAQPVVARDPLSDLASGDIGGYLGDGAIIRQQTSQCCRVLCCQPNIDW